mgnify:CR=1 FL=1
MSAPTRMIPFLFFSLFCLPWILSAEEHLLTSSIRIIEGVTVPAWEQRFLSGETSESFFPSTDGDREREVDTFPSPKRKNMPAKSPSHVSQPVRKKGVPVVPSSSSVKTETEREPSVSQQSPLPEPHTSLPAERHTSSATTVPQRQKPALKIDKEKATSDDNADKRKKERREILREERKERDYRNRRLE